MTLSPNDIFLLAYSIYGILSVDIHFECVIFYDTSNQKNCNFFWAWVSHFLDTETALLWMSNTDKLQLADSSNSLSTIKLQNNLK